MTELSLYQFDSIEDSSEFSLRFVMQQEHESAKDASRTAMSPSPRFPRTSDSLLSRVGLCSTHANINKSFSSSIVIF